MCDLIIIFIISILLLYRGYIVAFNISDYNISQLESPPPSFSFISLPPFLEEFQQVLLFYFHT
jgi:hypothetical protein